MDNFVFKPNIIKDKDGNITGKESGIEVPINYNLDIFDEEYEKEDGIIQKRKKISLELVFPNLVVSTIGDNYLSDIDSRYRKGVKILHPRNDTIKLIYTYGMAKYMPHSIINRIIVDAIGIAEKKDITDKNITNDIRRRYENSIKGPGSFDSLYYEKLNELSSNGMKSEYDNYQKELDNAFLIISNNEVVNKKTPRIKYEINTLKKYVDDYYSDKITDDQRKYVDTILNDILTTSAKLKGEPMTLENKILIYFQNKLYGLPYNEIRSIQDWKLNGKKLKDGAKCTYVFKMGEDSNSTNPKISNQYYDISQVESILKVNSDNKKSWNELSNKEKYAAFYLTGKLMKIDGITKNDTLEQLLSKCVTKSSNNLGSTYDYVKTSILEPSKDIIIDVLKLNLRSKKFSLENYINRNIPKPILWNFLEGISKVSNEVVNKVIDVVFNDFINENTNTYNVNITPKDVIKIMGWEDDIKNYLKNNEKSEKEELSEIVKYFIRK